MPLPRDDRSDPDQLRQAKGYTDLQVQFLRELLAERIEAEITRLEQRISAESERAGARADASDVATEVRTKDLEQRLAGMNEFRAALNDFAVRAATMEQLDSRVNPIRERIEKLENQANRFIMAKDVTDKTDLLTKEIDALKLVQSTQAGRSGGVQWVIGLIGFLVMLAGFALTWFALKPKP